MHFTSALLLRGAEYGQGLGVTVRQLWLETYSVEKLLAQTAFWRENKLLLTTADLLRFACY